MISEKSIRLLETQKIYVVPSFVGRIGGEMDRVFK